MTVYAVRFLAGTNHSENTVGGVITTDRQSVRRRGGATFNATPKLVSADETGEGITAVTEAGLAAILADARLVSVEQE
jgi:hypothetical protein